MAEVKNAKANSTKTLTIKEVQRDTLPFPNAEKLNMIKSMNALEQMYKSKLRNCEYDKSQLQSKLNIINGELNKRQGIP